MKAITSKVSQLYIDMKNPKTPWYAKALGFFVVAYMLSPIDLIPDFIPILGYLDDLIILPLLISLCIKMIPEDVWNQSEEEAKALWKDGRPAKWYLAIPIIIIWLLLAYWIVSLILK